MVNVPNVTLNNGEKMPAFGLGTFEVSLKSFHFCGHEIKWKIPCHIDHCLRASPVRLLHLHGTVCINLRHSGLDTPHCVAV